jgi:DNA-binding PadR family transcriptional regulator
VSCERNPSAVPGAFVPALSSDQSAPATKCICSARVRSPLWPSTHSFRPAASLTATNNPASEASSTSKRRMTGMTLARGWLCRQTSSASSTRPLALSPGSHVGTTCRTDEFTPLKRLPAELTRGPTLFTMADTARLSLAEYVVLAVIDEHPKHGFAVAALTAAHGELGRVWQIPRPVIYRSLSRLESEGLVKPGAVESGNGPVRQIFSSTQRGHRAVRRWLDAPVEHVRDMRSHLLMKLALIDRRGENPADLLRRQREALAPIISAFEPDRAGDAAGFDATLVAWRRASALAALAFLDEVAPEST